MNKALFLDRDGIINIDYGYTYKTCDFKPISSIVDIITKAKENNYIVICITNQSGIEKKLFSLNEFYNFMDVINAYLYKNSGYHLDKTYVCPHDDKVHLKSYGKECNCRKPRIGLFRKAIEEFSIDVNKSIMIGDKITDVEAAYNVKIKKRILINSRYNNDIIFSEFYTHRFDILKHALKTI